ncbi:MAG TPA: acyl-CoA dehydrogenase family protein [Pseudonocardia sp.]|jgi:alkylation response protein AidB-like acyl-CoA dehydrogenase|nr:acyl-CoA dehydrogenase family protein [Pseudonocardia sp.]
MDVELSDQQRELAQGAREFLSEQCPASRVRTAWDEGHDARLWSQLAEVGFLGAVVPEEYGGLGLGDLDLAVLLEEAGRVALPVPLLETAVAALTLLDAGSPEQCKRWLPAIAAGEVVATIGLPGQSLVVAAPDADLLILGRDGGLHAVAAERCELTAQPAFDASRRLATVRADTGADSALSDDPTKLARFADRAAVAAAATLVGIADHLVRESVAYVAQRHQFGRPIGSFQAIKYRLADAHLGVEFARTLTWVAAHQVGVSDAGDPEASAAASAAKVAASAAQAAANEHALQCHGGIGFTWEHDLQMWLKRGKALELAYGTPAAHRARIADGLFAAGGQR